jgi:hypothetical protein
MMNIEKTRSDEVAGAEVGRGAIQDNSVEAHGSYFVECFGPDGKLKWSDDIENLVTTAGKNDMLDKHLSGSAYTAAWYIGLIGATSYTTGAAVGDTSSSHGGWVEDQNYSQGARPTAAFSAASSGSKALSSALTYSINASTTIKGCFLISVATKGGTTGVLFSAGTFTGGDKVLQNGDTLNVSYTATLT